MKFAGREGVGRSVYVAVAVLLLIFLIFFFNPGIIYKLNINTSTTSHGVEYPPLIGSNLNITYPSDYYELANYALSLINMDRQAFGLSPVVLSPSKVAQQHADSMLYFGYFSHWDTQGYKPYMRYTLLGGEGAVAENVAYWQWTGPHYTSTNSVMQAIRELEYQMMYNDSSCCNNGHRDNILNPMHNRVSIGIAYNATTLYFVEDFENYYINATVELSGSNVIIAGMPLKGFKEPTEVLVFYDPIPTNLTVNQIKSLPRAYDPGKFVGGVLPPCSSLCSIFKEGITVYASKWVVSSSNILIIFPLSDFVKSNGPGVYTVYLLQGSSTDTAYTSVSFFIYS